MSNVGFDNRVISITGETKEDFEKALSFFFPDPTDTVECYAVDPVKGFILYWYTPEAVHRYPASGVVPKTSGGATIYTLPYKQTFEAAAPFVWNWLLTPDANVMRGPEPDHDGDNEVAWRVYNEDWTHVDGCAEGLVAIKPIWAMIGK